MVMTFNFPRNYCNELWIFWQYGWQWQSGAFVTASIFISIKLTQKMGSVGDCSYSSIYIEQCYIIHKGQNFTHDR